MNYTGTELHCDLNSPVDNLDSLQLNKKDRPTYNSEHYAINIFVSLGIWQTKVSNSVTAISCT